MLVKEGLLVIPPKAQVQIRCVLGRLGCAVCLPAPDTGPDLSFAEVVCRLQRAQGLKTSASDEIIIFKKFVNKEMERF